MSLEDAIPVPPSLSLGAPSVAVEAPPPLEALPLARTGASVRLLWVEACILLALAHILLVGYQLGVGNQSIQIPFLKHWIDGQLYARDPVVNTIHEYPSYFFQGVARIVRYCGLAQTYLVLHILTVMAVLLAGYWLVRTMFRDSLAAVIMAAFLFVGHHRGLGGDDLYSPGFTHTWAVFPLALVALGCLYRGWPIVAFLLTGVLFNLHALTAGYLLVMMGFWAGFNWRQLGWKKLTAMGAVFVVAAVPTVLLMLAHRQVFDADWVRITRIRSADHSFPSSWWQSNSVDVPRFLVIGALFALSLSFPGSAEQRRKTLLLAAGAGALFFLGTVCSEVITVKGVLRAQFFRSSRLLMVLMLAHIAWSTACGWRMMRGGDSWISRLPNWAEAFAATVAFACLLFPGLLVFLPLALVVATTVALANGRLSAVQAGVVGVAMLVCVVAVRQIQFQAPPFTGRVPMTLVENWRSLGWVFYIALAGGAGILIVSRLSPGPTLRGLMILEGAAVCVLLGAAIYKTAVTERLKTDNWIKAQLWARDNTTPDKVFLTPVRKDLAGFRIHSERPVVCEWRDGTQAYFSAAFGKQWLTTVEKLRPGIMFAEKGFGQIAEGKALEDMSEEELIGLASSRADYIVLPANKPKDLEAVYKNEAWAIYEPVRAAGGKQVPADVLDAGLWRAQQEFLRTTCRQNIEKYRKSDAKVEIVDASGRPIAGARYEAHLTRHAFRFGCSLPFFAPVEPDPTERDYCPPPVTQQELDRFLEVFNYTVIPFSGKWMYIERVEGKRDYAELDKYVDWCTKHGIEMEFHYITGMLPTWVNHKATAAEQAACLERHARELVERYADRIKVWQVVNDKYMLRLTPPIIQEMRKKHPDLWLGVADCTRFCATGNNGPLFDIYRGVNDLEMLASQNAKVDFFGIHGHSPQGLWPDVHQMYDTFDRFAKEGARVHVTEFTLPLSSIMGPVRDGRWTPELQAEFFDLFYTVCFSHPAVDSVNYWNLGPAAAVPSSGLLDDRYQPKPTFNKLKELIKERWVTRVEGVLPTDGGASFRGFHGDYEVNVTLPSGKVVTGKIAIKAGAANQFRLKADEAGGTLK